MFKILYWIRFIFAGWYMIVQSLIPTKNKDTLEISAFDGSYITMLWDRGIVIIGDYSGTSVFRFTVGFKNSIILCNPLWEPLSQMQDAEFYFNVIGYPDDYCKRKMEQMFSNHISDLLLQEL